MSSSRANEKLWPEFQRETERIGRRSIQLMHRKREEDHRRRCRKRWEKLPGGRQDLGWNGDEENTCRLISRDEKERERVWERGRGERGRARRSWAMRMGLGEHTATATCRFALRQSLWKMGRLLIVVLRCNFLKIGRLMQMRSIGLFYAFLNSFGGG